MSRKRFNTGTPKSLIYAVMLAPAIIVFMQNPCVECLSDDNVPIYQNWLKLLLGGLLGCYVVYKMGAASKKK